MSASLVVYSVYLQTHTEESGLRSLREKALPKCALERRPRICADSFDGTNTAGRVIPLRSHTPQTEATARSRTDLARGA